MSSNYAWLGGGHLTIIPAGANPTPIQVARLRDISLKFGKETKALEADRIAAVDMALVGLSVKLTAKTVEWNADAVAAILSGAVTSGTGRLIGVDGEAWTVPAPAGPYTVTAANTTGHVDLGVEDVTAGIAAGVKRYMTRVAAGPTTGQYSVAAGVYTFAAADASHALKGRYYYSSVSGANQKISNIAPRLDPGFVCTVFNTNATGKDIGFRFPNAHVNSFGLSFKTKDWMEQDVEIDIIGDDLDEIGTLYRS